MKKKLLSLLAFLLCVSILTSCAGRPVETPPEPEGPTMVSFTDSVGRVVEIPSNITRISPSGTLAQMFLIAIAPDLLSTIASPYSPDSAKYIPQEILGLPVVGHFYGSQDLNFESIAAIGPEIVIDIGDPKKTIVEDMDSITTNLAIPAVHITATLRSSPEAFRTLGKLLGREERGEALAAYCEKVLSQTDNIMSKVGGNKLSSLYCLGGSGLNVLPATSFHAEVLDYVTNNLAVVDSPAPSGSGNETDLEQISLWNPEVILFAPDSIYATAASDPVWNGLRAIASGKYYMVPEGPYNWMGFPPSINRYLSMLWLTKILYPEYAEFNLYEEVREYYSLFYGYHLTQADFDALTASSLPQ